MWRLIIVLGLALALNAARADDGELSPELRKTIARHIDNLGSEFEKWQGTTRG